MTDQFNFYDGLIVDEDTMNDAFSFTEVAVEAHPKTTQMVGINTGITISPQPVHATLGIVFELTVTGSAVAFDDFGKRVVPVTTVQPVFIDKDGNPITPPTATNSKVCRVFLEHATTTSGTVVPPGSVSEIDVDAIDSALVFIKAGGEFPSAGTPLYPSADPGEIIIGDIIMPNGAVDTQIGYINQDLADWIFKTESGVPATSLHDLISQQHTETSTSTGAYNSFPISDDDLALGAFLDGAGGTTIEEVLTLLISKIQKNAPTGSADGSRFVGIFNGEQWTNGDYAYDPANGGADPGDGAGSPKRQSIRDALVAIIQGLSSQTTDESGADRTGFGVGSQVWANGDAFDDGGTTTVQGAIRSVVNDLTSKTSPALNGLARIGANTAVTWANGDILDRIVGVDTVTTPDTAHDILERVVIDLGDDGTNSRGTNGGDRVGLNGGATGAFTFTHGDEASGSHQTVSDFQASTRLSFANMCPRDMESTHTGSLTLDSGRRDNAYVIDTGEYEASSLNHSGSGDNEFKLLFQSGNVDANAGNTDEDATRQIIRVYANNMAILFAFNCRYFRSIPTLQTVAYLDENLAAASTPSIAPVQENVWVADCTAQPMSCVVGIGDSSHVALNADMQATDIVGSGGSGFATETWVTPLHILTHENVELGVETTPIWDHAVWADGDVSVAEHARWRMLGIGTDLAGAVSGSSRAPEVWMTTPGTYTVA